mmetsp:Transcript_57437/g.121884  ORF Transcript_57437/g.121884 Transcript_57437/m.121884 type:complete len:1390 (-) Transcript_57437:180-4349(-)
MNGQANNENAPPPPPPGGGRPPNPPKSRVASDSSPNSSLQRPSPPPPRPKLIHVGGSSRGGADLHGRPAGRDRLNSRDGHYGQEGDLHDPWGGLRRGASVRGHRGGPQVWFEEQGGAMTDRRLLMASMDHEAVEDEAEATLLEVLERRQDAFDSRDGAHGNRSAGTPVAHRRGRSALPDIGLMNLGSASAQRPASAPSYGQVMQPPPRPSLQGQSRSTRRVTGRSRQAPLSQSLTFSGRGSMDSDLLLFSESDEELEGMGTNVSPREAAKRMSSYSRTSSQESAEKAKNHARNSSQASADRVNPFALDSQAPTPTLSNVRHKRVGSSLPRLGLERGNSESSQTSGTSGFGGLGDTPWERARRAALKIKLVAAKANENRNNAEELARSELNPNGELSDLTNMMEARRGSDHESAEGSHRSGGKGSASNGGHSSVTPSHESHSRGGSSGLSGGRNGRGHRSTRPFSGDEGVLSGLSGVENWLRAAENLQDLGQIAEEEEEEDVGDLAELNTNFLSLVAESHPDVPPVHPEETEQAPKEEAGGADERTPMMQQKVRPAIVHRKKLSRMWTFNAPAAGGRFHKFLLWWMELRKEMKVLAIAFDVPFVKERLWDFFLNEVSLYLVPAVAVAAFFFYWMNNPSLAILPTDASISWWILFVVRHFLTLQLAYMTEYVLVDVLAMRTLISAHVIGPLATLCTITSKGWPHTLTWWGLFNLLLIREKHGASNDMIREHEHWLSFSGIEMFNAENPSGGVVVSDLYSEILVSMIVAGVATSLKRTLVALFLGKRNYVHYKPKLEKVMESMILINEVADLGDAIDDFEFEKVDRWIDEPDQSQNKKSLALVSTSTRASTSRRESIQLQDKIRTSTMIDVLQKPKADNTEPDSEEEEEGEEEEDEDTKRWHRLRADSHVEYDSCDEFESPTNASSQKVLNKLCSNVCGDETGLMNTQQDILAEELPAMGDIEPPITSVDEPVQGALRNKSATSQIKKLLDDWEEPVNKQDKMTDPTIEEILVFRKALSLLQDTEPFGYSFGDASSRDSCIKSSKKLYKRLLSLSPGSSVLQFDLIGVLAYNVDGTFDDKKAKSLVRLFRPDKFDEVSLLHFVQSCDGVYKKIRYLCASVGNSSLIDGVLESIFNSVFGFVLALTIMSVLHLNPWALLVSLSTVLVSFAFAVGPSAAKLIEGMMMIAVRRPFDLGDRISIVECTGEPDSTDDPGYHDTWLVEDTSLFTTTLRLSRTNEISTVNNGSIANTRIVNHGRSQNALVNIMLPMRIDVTHDQVQIVQAALEQHIRDNPRVWASLVNFRIQKIDPSSELIMYSARIQHVKSWQDLLPILKARGSLELFCTEILTRLDIHYGGSSNETDVYIKELPDQQIFSQEAMPPMPSEIDQDHYD